MDQRFIKHVVVRHGRYTLTLDFLGVYPEFVYRIAQAGNIKGAVRLNVGGKKARMGYLFSPINLDDYQISEKLCHLIESKNVRVDWKIVGDLYDQALKKMKNEA